MAKGEPKRTPRGFITYDEFLTASMEKVTVRRSSQIGPRCTWLFIDGATLFRDDQPIELAPNEKIVCGAHLDEEGARRVIEALQRFVDGEE
jgi:hypothetical protein